MLIDQHIDMVWYRHGMMVRLRSGIVSHWRRIEESSHAPFHPL